MKQYLIVLAVLALSGCLSNNHHSGADLAKFEESEIVDNETTLTSLIHRHGEPTKITTNGDGTKTAQWIDMRAESKTRLDPLATGQTYVTNRTNTTLNVKVRGDIVVDHDVTVEKPPITQ